MSSCLLNHSLPGINKNDHQFGVGCTGDHVTRVLNMTRSIGNNKFSFGSRKIPVGNINRDSLFSFCTQSVCEKGKIYPVFIFVFRMFFKDFKLIL